MEYVIVAWFFCALLLFLSSCVFLNLSARHSQFYHNYCESNIRRDSPSHVASDRAIDHDSENSNREIRCRVLSLHAWLIGKEGYVKKNHHASRYGDSMILWFSPNRWLCATGGADRGNDTNRGTVNKTSGVIDAWRLFLLTEPKRHEGGRVSRSIAVGKGQGVVLSIRSATSPDLPTLWAGGLELVLATASYSSWMPTGVTYTCRNVLCVYFDTSFW